MPIFPWVFVAIQIVIICWHVAAIRRMYTIRVYMSRLIIEVQEAAVRDIQRGDPDWRWRFDALESVSLDRMLVQFWRDPATFFPDRERMVR